MSKARVLLWAAFLAVLITRRDGPAPIRDRFHDFEPAASFQVKEPAPLVYEGATYQASVGPEGVSFASKLTLGAYEAEQGGRRETLRAGRVSGEGFARARVERGPVVEDYVFENRRAEQLFRIAEPLGEGALTLRIAARSSFGGPVEEISRRAGGWKELWPFAQGIVFRDALGGVGAMYYGALVFDAAGRSMELDARWERNAIALEVPAAFMARATYPVTVDPWVELGAGSASGDGISINPLNNNTPRVAIDGSGNPVVTWSGNGDVFVRRWDGLAWVEMGAGSASGGGISGGSGSAFRPDVALDPSGSPIVAWSDGGSAIFVRRWNGTAWVEMGAGSASGGGISNSPGTLAFACSIAVDADGNVVVAWTDDSNGNREIYARRWDGLAWQQLNGSGQGGGISNTAGASNSPSVALDALGNPVVAWSESEAAADSEVYVLRWTGSAWAGLGTSAAAGGISANLGGSLTPRVAANSAGEIVVAWADDSDGDMEIYARRWTGSAWEEMGADSAQNGGISDDATSDEAPALALDGSGRPIVAWMHLNPGDYEIHAKVWNGSAWVEIGDGSARDGGISRNALASHEPAIAVGPDGHPIVAWQQWVGTHTATYVRRAVQASPLELKQFQLNGTTFIPSGGSAPVPTIVPRATLRSAIAGYDVRLQVEARPLGTAFSDVATAEGALVASGTEASCQLGPLVNGSYHWQARLVDAAGLASEWVAFGGNPETEADFVVAVPDTAPQVVNVESASNSCGLLGVEVLLLLALLRRRRA